ncbi:MAG TPA: hypothetical protein PK961_01300 [bacterium]|nr:hypothetical protein [bacterium]
MRFNCFLIIMAFMMVLTAAACDCGDDDDDNDDAGDDDTTDDDSGDDDLDDDDDTADDDDDTLDDDTLDDDTGDDDTGDDDTGDDDTGDDDTGDDDTGDDDTGDDDTADDDLVDDDTFLPDDCATLEDPLDEGSFTIVPWEYGDENDPDARTTDIRQYFMTPTFYVRFIRGIAMSAVPLHAVGYYPEGDGPFPVVLIVHGNHDPAEFSYPGYDYLTQHLATHGMIAVSVEEDFLNGSSGEMDARGIVLLRHLQLFREWNRDPSHPLYHKINMNWIGLAGHSRGGEGIGAAWYFNTVNHNPDDPLHNFDFRIRSLYAIAPVDGQLFPAGFNEVVLRDVDYFIMHGSHDGDVSDFQGLYMYDRALPVDEEQTADKGAMFVQGANHGQWNTVWAPGGDPWPISSPNVPLMSAEDQQRIGLLFVTGWYRWTLQGRKCYRLMAAGEREFPSFPTDIRLNRLYQGMDREYLAHYEEDDVTTTASWAGATIAGANLALWNENTLWPGSSDGALMAYNAADATYRIDLPAAGNKALDDLETIAFSIGQMYETSAFYNVFDEPQDLAVRLVVDGTPTDALPVSNYRTLLYPAVTGGSGTKSIMDTVRIPLEDFGAGLLASEVEAVIFEFSQKPSGYFSVDSIQFMAW